MWTGIIAFVRPVMVCSIKEVSMHHVSSSASTKTGMPPLWITACAVAIMVNEGIITSSSGFIPSVARARSKAVEPLVVLTPYLTPTYLAMPFSSFSMKLTCSSRQSEDIQFLSIAAFTYFLAFFGITGIHVGTLICNTPFLRHLLKSYTKP